MKILIRGWTSIPHSYSIVNCFHLVHLIKNFSDDLTIYTQEMPYYRKEWETKKINIFNKEYEDILNSIKTWKGEKVDLVYTITYPYILTFDERIKNIPHCVFYTCEFGMLNDTMFNIGKIKPNRQLLSRIIEKDEKLYFTTPSNWSANGMTRTFCDLQLYGLKNYVITHGVDTGIFYRLDETTRKSTRHQLRQLYNISNDDFVLLNIGAMTSNKGIVYIIWAMHYLVNVLKKSHYKLILKGSGDLYTCKEFLESFLISLVNQKIMTKQDSDNLLNGHVIFTDKTLSFSNINNLYNSVDLYISPYLAEGFNLTVLEALAIGLPVCVPETGSTKEFVRDIYNNGGNDLVYYIKSNVVEKKLQTDFSTYSNNYNIGDVVDSILQCENNYKNISNRDVVECSEFIEREYSWNSVSKKLYNYFTKILKK
jgi:glycosyltransferase involved in cell wall biosynthesis